jgi:hypothetical protein
MANKTSWKGEWHLVVDPDAAGTKGRLGAACPPFEEGVDVKWIADGVYGASGHFVRAKGHALPVLPLPRLGTHIHKVVTQGDPWFAGKFAPERLEELLNELGGAGWRVVGVTSSDRRSWAGSADDEVGQEMVILLERLVDEALLAEERRRRGERIPEVRSPGAPA